MTLRRRDALRVMTAGAWAAACAGDEPRFGGHVMSIQTWTFRSFDLPTALDMSAMLGLDHVELGSNHVSSASGPPVAEVLEALARRGLSCVTAGLEPTSADHAANERVFAFAVALGLRTILVAPPTDAWASLERLVAEHDVRLGVHNHGPGSPYSTIEDIAAALAGRDPRIGTIVDTGHYLRAGVDPVAALHAHRGRIFGVHLKDVAALDPAAPDVVLGTGVLDVDAVFVALRDANLPRDACVSLEYEANPGDPYDDVVAGLERAAQAARRAPG